MKLLAYIFGILALLIWISSVQAKKKKDILLLQSLANFFYALQYFIQGLTLAGLMNIVSTIRCLLFSYKAKHKKRPNVLYLILFIIIIILLGLKFNTNTLDIIPIIATILYTISSWVKSNSILRYTYIFCACIFLYYNYTVGAYIPLIGNIGEIISGIIAISRFKTKNKKSKKYIK